MNFLALLPAATAFLTCIKPLVAALDFTPSKRIILKLSVDKALSCPARVDIFCSGKKHKRLEIPPGKRTFYRGKIFSREKTFLVSVKSEAIPERHLLLYDRPYKIRVREAFSKKVSGGGSRKKSLN